MNSLDKPAARELFRALLGLETPEECDRFLTDLCTPSELTDLAERWKVVKLLDQDLAYREIHEKTGVSTATITRVARAYQYGAGGYRLMLDRMKGMKK